MPTYRVHLYKEFSRVVQIEAATPEDAIERWPESEDIDDWEESGDEYVSEVTDADSGTAVWSMQSRTANLPTSPPGM